MHNKIKLGGIVLFLVTSLACAEADFDFEALMEAVDTNAHNLQDSITNKDSVASIALAKEMQNSFKLVEGYFAKRGNADDAVIDAKRYEDMAAEIVKFVDASDFTAASNKAIEISKACDTACHDTYKPL